MLNVTLAQLRGHAGRLVATCLAIVIAVGFVVATLVLNHSSETTMRRAVGAEYLGTDAVLTSSSNPLADPEGDGTSSRRREVQLLEAVAGVPGVRAAVIDYEGYGGLRLPDGKGTLAARIGSVATDEGLRWQQPVSGRLPAATGEVALDQRAGVTVGGSVEIVPSMQGENDQPVTQRARVVGLLDLRGDPFTASAAPVFATEAQARAWGGEVLQVRVGAAPGTAPDALLPGIESALQDLGIEEVTVMTGAQRIDAEVDALTGSAAQITVVLLVFAAVAVLVAALVVANTFSVLLAQRTRELALLRCVGAVGSQVRRSVLLESLVIGVLASIAGVLGGIGLAGIVAAAVRRSDVPLSLDVVAVPWSAIACGMAVGVLVTVVAAVAPAQRATRVSPLAALRPIDPQRIRSRAGLLRLGLGLLVFLPGVAILTTAVAGEDLKTGLVGGSLSFLGVVLLGRRAIPPVVSLTGRLAVARSGVPGELAALNAVRNPQRTAATATALLIGVTLTTAMVVGAASVRTTGTDMLDAEYPTDVVVGSSDGGALQPALVRGVPNMDGVAAAVPVLAAQVRVTDGARDDHDGELSVVVDGVDPAEAARVVRSTTVGLPAPGTLSVPKDRPFGLGGDGTRVTLAAKGQEVTLTVREAEGITAPTMTSADLRRLVPRPAVGSMWLRLADGQDADTQAQVVSRLTDTAGSMDPDSYVEGLVQERAEFDSVLTGLLLFVSALLGVAVVIAVIGVGNTIALSVIERRQEFGLVRALGLTRGQLRATLLWEAVLIAGVAAVLGAVLGAAYGAAGTVCALGAVGDVTITIPWAQVLLIVVVATVAGALASVLPSRRAARVSPVAAIA